MKKNKTEDSSEQEERNVRHTISATESFTLAKDVYDFRCFFRNIYDNRSVIGRRLNIFALACSLVFTMVYIAYVATTTARNVISVGQMTVFFVLLGVYALLIAAFIVAVVWSGKAQDNTLKKYRIALKVFRMSIRVVSIAMAVVSIVVSCRSGSADGLAWRIVVIVFSAICITVQAIPLFFGGIGGFVRWAIAPAKSNTRFAVLLKEWYGHLRNGDKLDSVKDVAKRYIEPIGACIDGYLIPAAGKKKIRRMDAALIYSVIDKAQDVPLTEGIFKNVFEYAEEAGYINFNPVKDMNLEGSIENEPITEVIKEGIVSIGKRVGSAIAGKFFGRKNVQDIPDEPEDEKVQENSN